MQSQRLLLPQWSFLLPVLARLIHVNVVSCLRLLALSVRVNSLSAFVVVSLQLCAVWRSCHVALLALSHDDAVATQLAVYFELTLLVFALLLVTL